MKLKPRLMQVSRLFVETARRSPLPHYRLAAEAGPFHPAILSEWLNGQLVRDGDARVIAVGRLLGLGAKECFAPAAWHFDQLRRAGRAADRQSSLTE